MQLYDIHKISKFHPDRCCIIIWMDCNVFIFFQIFVKEYRNHTFLIVQNA